MPTCVKAKYGPSNVNIRINHVLCVISDETLMGQWLLIDSPVACAGAGCCNLIPELAVQGFTVAAHPINKTAAKVGSAGREDATAGSEHPARSKGSVKAGNEGYMDRFGKHEGDKPEAEAAAPPKFPPTVISFKPPDYTL